MAHIKVVEPGEATDPILKRQYEAATKRAGSVAHVLQVQSLTPRILQAGVRFYQELMIQDASSSLTRAEREMVAVVVSARNECFY